MSGSVVVSMTMWHDASLERPSRLPFESMLNDGFATPWAGSRLQETSGRLRRYRRDCAGGLRVTLTTTPPFTGTGMNA